MKEPTTAREMLALIDSFLCRLDDESALLISALSAIRGQDYSGELLEKKNSTTGVLRAAMFPRLREHYNNLRELCYSDLCLGMLFDYELGHTDRVRLEATYGHFHKHATVANSALISMGLLLKNGRLPAAREYEHKDCEGAQ